MSDPYLEIAPIGLRNPTLNRAVFRKSSDYIAKFQFISHYSRRSVAVYQSTGSLHSDGHSSNSMSPAPSPSPTQVLLQSTMKTAKTSTNHQKIIKSPLHATKPSLPQRPLSGSLSNLTLTGSRKWNSTSDFRDQSPLMSVRYIWIWIVRLILPLRSFM